ncbi:MAG: porphobilinogen synthase [Gemmatimonadaceae bacterium]|nr:porphobilinogen synthase [Gemmatimonadaceae bacterium]
MARFPEVRSRRLRRTSALRRLFSETDLTPARLVLPLFVRDGAGVRNPVRSMPGVSQTSVDELLRDVERAAEHRLGGVILFGIPERKDATGSEAWSEQGAVQQAVRAIKREFPGIVVITDVCLCEYMEHGHCGIVRDGEVDNDATLELLARAAASHAAAGADIVAPSDMMDGRVAAIRARLDSDGFHGTAILSYAAKHASAFYGPFRDAAESAPAFGDRRSYQMDPANARESLREVRADLDEGADAIMVKPAGPCLDLIWRVREGTDHPVAAYQVSGEYAMIKAAAALGSIDESAAMMESLVAIRRAGADIIVTYFAVEAAARLRE